MKGLINNNNIVEYIERPLKDTGSVRRTNGFRIPLEGIKIIGVRAIVLLDDEDFIVSLIDSNKKEYKFSSLEFNTLTAKFLEEKFNISLTTLWGTFTYKEHINGVNKVLYPKEFEGKKLYKGIFESPKSFFYGLNIFFEPHKGILTNEVEAYIESISVSN
ncbi:hypothetical protein ATO12_03645 [Sporocytophaga myxococcoides]|uniref:Uncharacterized protein n=1 Tax=Sporocytophaga myxococcoides TaxID=153721 RepID=A0A098LBY9_9BACT|nr:hypothetical protein [Sporocytophaga myxococcoides]GAL84460.1 hypothetical protein ATO12_03645 [Sporocytophaga myxococcoides]